MESSNAIARHIEQVASDPQAAQINLMRHQHTDLPVSKHKKKRSFVKPRLPSHKNDASALMHRVCTRTKRDAKCVEIQQTLKVTSVQQRNFDACVVISMETSQAYVIKRNKLHSRQENQRPICCKSICGHSEDCSSSNESFCLEVKIQ